MLTDLCSELDVICVQEHWLAPDNLNCLNNFNSDYVGFSSSAMETVLGKNILRGRPFGGVGTLVNKQHVHKTKCLTREDRYLILSVYDYFIVNVYMPVCKDSDVYKNCVLEILAGISNVFDQYPNAKIIMAGDFNCDVGSNSIGGKLIQQFMQDHKLICCDKWCDSSLQFTYCHASLGHRSFVDHILISGSLEHTVQSCAILDSGTNLSDHLPVTLKLLVTDSIDHGVSHRATKDVKLTKLRWDKANLNNYYWDTFNNLSCYDVL